jgi:hypothetical protein
MLRRLLHCFAACLLVLSLAVPAVRAQPTTAPAAETEKGEKSTPVFPYFLLILYSLLILTIVCMPSRKA